MAIVQLGEHRPWVPGPEGFLQRLRDLIERGRIDLSELRLSDLVRWMLERIGASSSTPATLSDACAALEGAARLALLKARRLNGMWQALVEEEGLPWAGPPAELAPRRSWLAARREAGPLSFVGLARRFEAAAPQLAPVPPAQLRAAMLAVLARERPTPLPVRERIVRVSLESRASLILDRLSTEDEIVLDDLAGESRDTQIATFLACLTLSRQGRIALQQDELFGAIRLRPATTAIGAIA
jgi:chromatin segregation and condensation protein Rec8/ScpA/Scc1 (kleisin family)